MMHEFSEDEWNDFLDGRADAVTGARFESHLGGCDECADLRRRLRLAEGQLRLQGGALQRAPFVPDEQVEAAWQRVVTQLRAKEITPQRVFSIPERLRFLEDLLMLLCGARTASNALRVAAEGLPAETPEQLSFDQWPQFLNKLTAIATVMCGKTGARLVQESGRI